MVNFPESVILINISAKFEESPHSDYNTSFRIQERSQKDDKE